MGSAYTIFGKQVPSHVLAILTLGTTAGLVLFPRGGNKSNATPTPTPVVPAAKEDDFDLEKLLNDLTKEETK